MTEEKSKQNLNNQYYDDEINLYEYYLIIKKNIIWILIFSFLCTVGSIIYAKSLPNIYKASTVFFVPKAEGASSMSSLSSLGASFGLNIEGGGSSAELVENILKSKRMSRDVLNKFNFIKVYESRAKQEKSKKTNQNAKPLTYKEREHSALKMVMGSLTVEKNKSDFITLSFEDIDKELTSKVANYYVANLDNINEELELTPEKPMVKILDKAEVPVEKSKPKRSQIVILGFISGVFLSVFASFFLEFVKNIKKT